MKRLIFLLFIISLPCLVSVARDFSYTYEGQTLVYTVLDEDAKTCETKAGVLHIGTPGNKVSGKLVLPEKVMDGNTAYTLTRIGDFAFNNCTAISGLVTIPNSVTSIGSRAFSYCSGFTGPLIIPNSVTSIGSGAFRGCSGLTGPLTIPNSVISLGDEVFRDCSGFTGPLTIPNSVTSIGGGAFEGCSGLTGSLTIPNSVTTIYNETFEGCSGLTGPLTIPDSVTSIGDDAFYECSGLTGPLTIPNSVTSIGWSAFSHCTGLTGPLIIPDAVTSIGGWAFNECSGLTGPLTIPNSVTSIESGTFQNCSGLTGPLTIPNSVTSIGWSAFQNCSGLTGSLTIPNSVISIDLRAFSNCSGFTGPLTISNSVTSIGDRAFENCSGLTGPLIIPNSVNSIGKEAFAYCSGFTGPLTISNSLTSIEERVFIECSGLTGPLTIPNSVTSIGDSAFEDCSDLTGPLTIPNSVTSIGNSAFSWCLGLTGPLTIPNSVTSIGSSAFAYCQGFTGPLTIPNSVTLISSCVFEGCIGLTELYLPENLVGIYGGAFVSGGVNMNIERVYCKALTPPNILENIFGKAFDAYTTDNATLIVPTESIELYKTAFQWEDFFKIKGDKEVDAVSIELNKTTVSLKVTETVQLTATVLPEDATDKSVTWSSSDTSIVSVDETGLVTAINVGNAVVSATTGNGLSAECLVTVVETPVSEVIIDKESLGISGDDLEMRVGEVRTINVTVLPETATDKSVRFESFNPTVASVDSDGRLTALSLGSTTITVTANSGVSASINVIVVATPVESVILNRTEASLKVSEQLQLTATVLPEDATDKSVTWSSSEPSIVSVDETGLVTAINIGWAVVTATTSNGLSAECLVKVVDTPVSEVIIDKESLGISGDDFEMIVGEVRTVNVTVLPETATDKSVDFYSSNPAIASVDATGVLTALTLGTTTLTVTARSGVSASINVIVKNPAVGTVDTYVSPLKVREGSEVSVAAEQPQGGYESGWEWSWSIDGVEVSRELEFDFRPTMPTGLEREIENIRFDFHALNRNPQGVIISQINAETESVSVYRSPRMPLQLLRKGDGSSHTLVVMAGIDNQKLDELGYTFVYGYTDRQGIDNVIETTPLRYCRTQEIIYDNPDIKLWVYSQWQYDDGSVVTSGKRYLDGYADDDFDASVFDGRGISQVASHDPDAWIRSTGNGVEINMISDQDSRIDIYDMLGRVVRSCSVKGGVPFNETFVFDKADGNVFIVKASSGSERVVRKVVVR
ncbi:MAG: leucine-rich repeat protein [Muribaculaceae bacterium]|nr:leucine-rich repeat protein [Muribaculaceae bacterium]